MLRNLLMGLVIAAVIGLLGIAAVSGRRGPRIAFVTAATTWAAINGILGIVLIFGWTATRHVFMARNENLLQFDPLSLALAVILPWAVMRGRAVGAARRLAVAIVVIALVGLALKLVPLFIQKNVAVMALTLPVHVAIAWVVRALPFAPASAPSPTSAAAAAAVSRSAA